MKRVLFPGSFDPLTNGHVDLIERSSHLFDEVIVLMATNTSKQYLFSEAERLDLIAASLTHLKNVKVEALTNDLIANYYQKVQADAVVRGVRNTTDFEYENTIAVVNRKQLAAYETVVLYAADEYRYLSSSFIKEIAHFHGDISDMVPPVIEAAMKEKYNYPT